MTQPSIRQFSVTQYKAFELALLYQGDIYEAQVQIKQDPLGCSRESISRVDTKSKNGSWQCFSRPFISLTSRKPLVPKLLRNKRPESKEAVQRGLQRKLGKLNWYAVR